MYMQLPFKHGFPTKTAKSSTFGSPSKRAPKTGRIGSKKGFPTEPEPTKHSDRPIRDPRNGPILRSSDPQKSPDQVRVEFLLRFFSLKGVEGVELDWLGKVLKDSKMD